MLFDRRKLFKQIKLCSLYGDRLVIVRQLKNRPVYFVWGHRNPQRPYQRARITHIDRPCRNV